MKSRRTDKFWHRSSVAMGEYLKGLAVSCIDQCALKHDRATGENFVYAY